MNYLDAAPNYGVVQAAVGPVLAERRDEDYLAALQKGPAEKPGEAGWHEIVIRCQGPRVQIWVDGLQTVDYREREADIDRRGIIGLQVHGGPPLEAWYRQIRIRSLAP